MTAPTPEQCPAVNDGLEGVRCHGDVGHVRLHWADVSGDGDITEWGDSDELWDEIDRLRTAADQLEAVRSWAYEHGGHFSEISELDAILNGATGD